MPKRSDKSALKARTVLGGHTKFNGSLRFDDSLEIDGYFEGAIESTGYLMVEADAEVIADVRVGTLVVAGVIRGNVHASERLELLYGGQIVGNVRCPSLVMAEGTGIHGTCEMLADPAGIDIFAMPQEQLKKNLSRVE